MTDVMIANVGQPELLKVTRRVDRQSVRVAVLLLFIAVLNGFDLVYTLFAHGQGMLAEMNPIAANLFRMKLEPSVICFKLMTTLCGSFILWRLRYNKWVLGACWLVLIIYAALAFRWFLWSQNYTQIMELKAKANITLTADAGF